MSDENATTGLHHFTELVVKRLFIRDKREDVGFGRTKDTIERLFQPNGELLHRIIKRRRLVVDWRGWIVWQYPACQPLEDCFCRAGSKVWSGPFACVLRFFAEIAHSRCRMASNKQACSDRIAMIGLHSH